LSGDNRIRPSFMAKQLKMDSIICAEFGISVGDGTYHNTDSSPDIIIPKGELDFYSGRGINRTVFSVVFDIKRILN